MPTFINKLPGGLSIDGAGGHTYHIDGSQSIEITDEDVVVMREMGAFKILEEQGSVVIEGEEGTDPKPKPKPKPDPEPNPDPEPESESPPRRRVRKPNPRGDAE